MIDHDIQKVCRLANKDQRDVLFRPSKSLCTVCHNPLEVYYAESRIYAVRCTLCEIVTVLSSTNPIEAAAWVGVKKPSLRNDDKHEEELSNV